MWLHSLIIMSCLVTPSITMTLLWSCFLFFCNINEVEEIWDLLLRVSLHSETSCFCSFFYFVMTFGNSCYVFCRVLMTDDADAKTTEIEESPFSKLPDHLLIEIFVRVPHSEWAQISSVSKLWANLLRGESFWHTALVRTFPLASRAKRWPGPIPRGLSKR